MPISQIVYGPHFGSKDAAGELLLGIIYHLPVSALNIYHKVGKQ